jgi:CheY-like chemotaxis protein
MNYNETRNYIERQLVKLGWKVQLDKAGYKKIFQYSGGQEDRLGHLYYKLVSVGSKQSKREITENTVNAAIDDLMRMDEILDKSKVNDKVVPQNRAEQDRISIDQLARALETVVALEEKEARVAEERFPRVEPVQSKAAPAESTSLPRILVVDDSPTIRAAVTKALKDDFSFVQASDGEEALNLLKGDDSIQLLITDLMMPKLDGYGLIRRIRSDKNSPRLAQMPIIVVTTLEDTNAKLRAVVAGANDFVTKSTDAMELKMRVMARYKVSQSTKALEQAKSAIQRASAATPMPASQTPSPPMSASQAPTPPPVRPATPRNAASAGAAAGSGSSTAAAAAARSVDARSMEARMAKPEVRRPISPAAVSSPFSTSEAPSMGEAFDALKRARDWLAKVNPLTATTLGATALIVLIIGAIFAFRPAQRAPQMTAGTSGTDALVSTQNGSAGSSEPPAVIAEAGQNRSATPKTSPGIKAQEQTPDPKKERPAVDAVSAGVSSSGTPAPTSKAQTTEQTPAVSTQSKTVATQSASSEPAADAGKPELARPPVEPETGDSGVKVAAAAPGAAGKTAAASVSPNLINQAELSGLAKRFKFVYEAGDIEQFLRLFDDDVRTNDRYSKDGLREDYEDLFKTTEMREMVLGTVTWEARDNHADGWGNFEVKVRKIGEQEIKAFKGSLTFYVEKIDGRIRIKRLYHGQWRAG